MQEKGWWEKSILGDITSTCVYHCILPIKIQARLSGLDKAKAIMANESQQSIDFRKATLYCCLCDAYVVGIITLCSVRILIVKTADNIYDIKTIFAPICTKCVSHSADFRKSLILSDDIGEMLSCFVGMLDNLVDDVIQIANANNNNYTGQRIIDLILQELRLKHADVMKTICLSQSYCFHCNLKVSTDILHCVHCNAAAYCSEWCAKKDWDNHMRDCEKLRKGPFFFHPILL